jgi:hypothetical protein
MGASGPMDRDANVTKQIRGTRDTGQRESIALMMLLARVREDVDMTERHPIGRLPRVTAVHRTEDSNGSFATDRRD